MNDTVANPNTMILKPVGNPATPSAEADRLPADVVFVTYEVLLNFTSLVLRKAVQGPLVLNITTVAKFPQSTRIVMNAGVAAAPVTVTTYYGPPNIRAMTCDAFRRQIPTPTWQSGAGTLVEPNFRRVNATINTTINESNQNEVISIAFPTPAEDIKTTSCPGWAHRPSQVFDNITQV